MEGRGGEGRSEMEGLREEGGRVRMEGGREGEEGGKDFSPRL